MGVALVSQPHPETLGVGILLGQVSGHKILVKNIPTSPQFKWVGILVGGYAAWSAGRVPRVRAPLSVSRFEIGRAPVREGDGSQWGGSHSRQRLVRRPVECPRIVPCVVRSQVRRGACQCGCPSSEIHLRPRRLDLGLAARRRKLDGVMRAPDRCRRSCPAFIVGRCAGH